MSATPFLGRRFPVQARARKVSRLLLNTAALTAPLVLNIRFSRADVTATWAAPSSGEWSQASQWSGAIVPQNGNPSGTLYDAVIAAPSNAPYTVTIDNTAPNPVQVESITLNSANATLNVANPVDTSLLDVEAGTFDLSSTLSGTLIEGAVSGSINAYNTTTLNNITLDTTLNVLGNVASAGTFAMNGGTVNIGEEPNSIQGQLNAGSNPLNLTGTGQVIFNGENWAQDASSDGGFASLSGSSTTIGSGITLSNGVGEGFLSGATVTNNGAITVTAGHYLFISGQLVNNGTINLNQGDLVLLSPQTSTSFQNINETGSNVYVQSTLTVPNGTLSLGGSITLCSSTDATQITSSDGSALYLAPPIYAVPYSLSPQETSVSFTSTTGVEFSTNVYVSNPVSTGTVSFAGNLQLNSSTMYVGAGTIMSVATGNVTGTGEMIFQHGSARGPNSTILGSSNSLVVGPGITLATDPQTSDSYFYLESNGIVNEGTIASESPGGSLSIIGTGWQNSGTLEISNGTMVLSGSVNSANIGNIVNTDGTLEFSALTVNNSSSSWTVAANDGLIHVTFGSEIEGGTVVAGGGALSFLTTSNLSTVDAVTLQGDFSGSNFAGANFTDGLSLASATVGVGGTADFTGTQAVTGTGIFELQNASSTSTLSPVNGALTIGPEISIVTDNASGQVGSSSSNTPLINQGTISSQSNGATLTVTGASVTNLGTLSASNGGVLVLQNLVNDGLVTATLASVDFPSTWTNTGTVSTSGSTVTFAGSFTNGGTISLNGSTLNDSGNFTNSGVATLAGVQNWSPHTTFTNTAGTATFETDAGSASEYNLSMNITGGTVVLASPQHWGGLTVSGEGVLDVNDNHLIIDYAGQADPISSIVGYIKSGYNNGGWNGSGIISSTAQTPTNGLRYGVGWADGADNIVSGLSSGQIELKYTLLGDANLDGTVNGSDFSILAANFGQGYTNWDQGNFLFTPAINGSDFSALAANFGQGDSGATLAISQADIEALDSFAIANALPLPTFAAVPEPTAAALMLAGVTLAARRRRNYLATRNCEA